MAEALHLAAGAGHAELCKVLLEPGTSGETPSAQRGGQRQRRSDRCWALIKKVITKTNMEL